MVAHSAEDIPKEDPGPGAVLRHNENAVGTNAPYEAPPPTSLAAAVSYATKLQRNLARRSPHYSTEQRPLEKIAGMLRRSKSTHKFGAATVALSGWLEKVTLIGQLAQQLQTTIPEKESKERLLVITTDKDNVSKFTSQDHAVPLLTMIAPGSTVGKPYAYNAKDLPPPTIAVVEQQKLPTVFENTKIPVRDFGLVIYDSGNEPPDVSILEMLQDNLQANCINLVTPGQSLRRKKWPLPIIYEGSTAQAIRNGSINGVELYTFRIPLSEPTGTAKGQVRLFMEEKYNDRVVEGVVNLVEQGRRVALYCQEGHNGGHIDYLAQKLRAHQVPNVDATAYEDAYRPIVATSLSRGVLSWTGRTHAIRDFNNGDIDVMLTTSPLTKKLGVIYADALVVATHLREEVALEKLIASCVAPNPLHRQTVILEFLPLPTGDNKFKIFSARTLFDENIVRQGMVAGGYLGHPVTLDQAEAVPFTLSASLQVLADSIDGNLLRPVTLARAATERMTPPTQQISFAKLHEIYPEYMGTTLKAHLAKGGFAGETRRDETQDERIYLHLYPAEAEAYLQENPLPPLAVAGELTQKAIATLLDTSVEIVGSVIKRLGDIQKVTRTTASGGVYPHLTASSAQRVIVELADLPVAETIDRTVDSLDKTLGCGIEYINRVMKRRQLFTEAKWATTEKLVCSRYLKDWQAAVIVQEFSQTPQAGDDDVLIVAITRSVSMSIPQIITKIPRSYWARLREMRAPDSNHVSRRMPGVVARAIVRMLQPEPSKRPPAWLEKIDVPLEKGSVQAAFPAGERPYVRPGMLALARTSYPAPEPLLPYASRPRTRRKEEPLELLKPATAPEQPHKPSAVWRPGQNIQPKATMDEVIPRQTLPPPGAPQAVQDSASRQTDAPGDWEPVAIMNSSNFISITERLTPDEIALRLGIPVGLVHAALARIESHEHAMPRAATTLLSGDRLSLLREQLVGIPLEYITAIFDINPERVQRFLRRHGYELFNDNRYSPGAFAFLSRNINRIKSSQQEAQE